MITFSFIRRVSLFIFMGAIAFTTTQTASAQAPFNITGSVANAGAINGVNSNAAGFGVRGVATSPSGATSGVYGLTTSPTNQAVGVFGYASSNAGTAGYTYGVWGQSNSPRGLGVYGVNKNGGIAGYFDGKFVVKNAFSVIPHATSPNIIGGYKGNTVSAGVFGATISGGGTKPGFFSGPQTVNGSYGTISGGLTNSAGNAAAVGGGALNMATGVGSTVPGGGINIASGAYSFAAGFKAKAQHKGAFVWADSSNTNAFVGTVRANQTIFRSHGGFYIFTKSSAGFGAKLDPGATAWVAISDRNSKEKVVKVDSREVLEKLTGIEIATWQYKGVETPVRHMGPMAQDFYTAYRLGADDKGISTLDTDGVALAAIQGLYDVVKEKEARIAELESRLLALEDRLN